MVPLEMIIPVPGQEGVNDLPIVSLMLVVTRYSVDKAPLMPFSIVRKFSSRGELMPKMMGISKRKICR